MSISTASFQETQIRGSNKSQSKYLWPEWTDSEYNSIRMDPFHKDKAIIQRQLFFDQENSYLPDILQSEVVKWVRTYEFFKEASDIILYQEYDTYKIPNLIELNRHLMVSPLMRLIISSFGILQYFGDRYTNKMPKFFQSTTPREPWRPWFHLYSYGKIRKDGPMEPAWNSNGVCVARLFYGGSWVLIRMDDYIPIDKQGRALLPLVASADKDSDVAILWPIFLTKALLKIAALTWTESNEIVDFSPIHNITGWIYEKVNVRGVDKRSIWDMCRPYATAYTWPEDDSGGGSKKRSRRSKGKSTADTETKPNTAVSSRIDKQMFLCLLLKDIRFFDYGFSQFLGPCFGHLCYVDQTRNCVFEKPEKIPELEPWKKHRWVEWARKRKIYPPDPYAESSYAFEILSTFRRSLDDSKVEPEVNPPPSQATPSLKSGKSSKKGKAKVVVPTQVLTPSPLHWCNFDHIVNHIRELHIFFIPETFQNSWLVTLKSGEKKSRPKSPANNTTPPKTERSRKSDTSAITLVEEKLETQILSWPNELLISKNSPIYLFIDSLSTKFLLFSLQHKCLRYTKPLMGVNLGSTKNNRSKASLLMEKYTFESNEFGEVEFFMNTMGVAARSLTLPEGRYVFRLWLKSETPSNFQILSNTNFSMDKALPILESMTTIPFRIEEYANSFSNSFSIYFNSMGYEDFQISMRAFYALFQPIKCTKQRKIKLNETIVDGLFDLCDLCENPKEVKYALSVLFGPRLSQSLIEEYSIENSAARRIQARFKGFYVRRVLVNRFIDSKNYETIQDTLREFYSKFFGVEQRNWTVPKIFLTLIKKTNIYDFNFYPDYTYYLTTYTFRSHQRVRVEANSWAPLLMCKFYVSKSIVLRITIQSELTTQIVRVFNNDTNEEMPRFLDNVKTQIFNPNNTGYTIVAYGWNLEPTDIWDTAWILQIAHLMTDDLTLSVLKCEFKECHKSQLEGIYVPNTANNICGCFIRIKNDTTVVIRAGASYDQAKIKVQLQTDTGILQYELSGTHGVVLPPILLRHIGIPKQTIRSAEQSPRHSKSISSTTESLFDPPQPIQVESLDTLRPYKDIQDRQQLPTERSKLKETRYYLKVDILDDSWPCKNTEWIAIQDYKRSKELKVRDGSTGSERSTTSGSKKAVLNKGAPLWTINIMSFDPVTLQPDTYKDNAILQLKTNWELASPGRFYLANKLRYELLQDFQRSSRQEDFDDVVVKKMTGRRSSALFKNTSNLPQKIFEERTSIPKWTENKLLNWNDYPTTSPTYNFIKGLILEKNRHIMTTDKHWIKTREDERQRHLFREYQIQDFQKRYRMMNTYMEYILDDYAQRFGSVYDHLEESMLTSEELMAEAYDLRRYIAEQERPRGTSLTWGGM